MIAPVGAPSLPEAIRAGSEVYGALRRGLSSRKLSTGLGDEGGFAPEITEPEDVLRLLVQASPTPATGRARRCIDRPWTRRPRSSARPDGRYCVAGDLLDQRRVIERFALITRQFPVHLIEDGLGEDDDEGWIALTGGLGRDRTGRRRHLLYQSRHHHPCHRTGIGNAALIKLNQIGTVTETLEAMAVCREAGYRQFVSHRSGETDDSFIADLAVGTGCGHLKSGAPARGERVAKYNRLLEIAAAAPDLRYGHAGL